MEPLPIGTIVASFAMAVGKRAAVATVPTTIGVGVRAGDVVSARPAGAP
jgi:hypothetical protein